MRISPVSAAGAKRGLEELNGAKDFSGVRRAAAADLEGFADLAPRLSWLAHDLSDSNAELDLNPVVML